MSTYQVETTIDCEGELHLEHLPFHAGEKVTVILVAPEEADVRRSEYDSFMKGYADEDSVYDAL